MKTNEQPGRTGMEKNPEAMDKCEGRQEAKVPSVDGNREVRIQCRIKTAIRMALSINKNTKQMADEPLFAGAIDGIVQSTTIEIIYVLGMKPSYTNLRRIEP